MSISDPLNSHDFFHDGLGLSLKRGKYGFMNKQGKTVIKRRFTYAEDFSEGLAVVGVANARLGFIDTKGTFVIPPVFDGATSFANKLAAVKIDPRLVAEDSTVLTDVLIFVSLMTPVACYRSQIYFYLSSCERFVRCDPGVSWVFLFGEIYLERSYLRQRT